MMTLEEAIEHYKEVAEELDMKADFETDCQRYAMSEPERTELKECAKDHRQLAEWLNELLRARVLLKATYELLEKADDSPYVLNALEIIVNYDDAECDGYCLKEDIEYYFDEYGSGK